LSLKTYFITIINYFSIIMKKLLFAFLSMTFLLASCAKDGAVGPQGPQGNANVQATTITVNAADWQNGGNHWKTTLSVPSITQAVADRGIVAVYYNYAPQPTDWIPLPLVTYPSTYSQTWTPFNYVGGVRIEIVDSDRTLPIKPVSAYKFKVVTVAPSLHKMPKVDWNNYAAVAKAFNLPD
jgi:hypothetical protein